MDDLQTLCTAALRRCYAAIISSSEGKTGCDNSDDKTISHDDSSSCAAAAPAPSSSSSYFPSTSSTSSALRTPIDRRAVKAFIESLDMEDNPRLQVESAWALTVLVDRLEPHEQRTVKDGAIPLLIDLLLSVDDAASNTAEAVVGQLLQGERGGEILREYDLEPMVEGLMGNDDGSAFNNLSLLSHIFYFDKVDHNEFVQRIVDTGVLTRFVQFLRRDDHPNLQEQAMQVLTDVVHCGDPDLTRAVVDNSHGEFVANVVRLLSEPPTRDTDTKISAATWIMGVANRAPTYRDALLRGGAMPPLVDMVQSQDPRAIRSAACALRILCEGDPPPNVDILRPAIPALARLIGSPDDEDAVEACRALGWIALENDEMVVQPIVDAGPEVCRRLVEFLLYPSVQTHVVDVLAYIADGNDAQRRAIFDHQLIPNLVPLLSSPCAVDRKKCCWIIGNFASGGQDRIQQLIDADAVPPLLRCLADDDAGVRSWASRAVGDYLTAEGSARQVQVLVEAGCLPLLLNLLSETEGEDADTTVQLALLSIENILIVGSGGGTRPNQVPAQPNAPIVAGTGSLALNLMAETLNVLSAGVNGALRPNAMAERISSIPGGWSKIWALIPHQDDEIRNHAVRVLTAYYVPAQIRATPALPAPVPLEGVAGIIVPIPLGAIATSLFPAPVGGTARGRRRTRSASDAGEAAENPPPPPRQRRRRQP